MCGIAGILWGPTSEAGRDAARQVRRMADSLAHRGPDDAGMWLDLSAGIALGHRRLAVIDRSAAGAQPMVSPSGRYVLSYNGEVYTHRALRAELEAAGAAPAWRGTSDTETLAAACEAFGPRALIPRLSGMFALAIWDRADRVLTLARDRFGEKPLYYGWQGAGPRRAFLFGSELRALRAHPYFAGEIAPDVLPHYLRHGHVRVGRSIYRGIAQVRPGEILRLSAACPEPEREDYWSAPAAASRARAAPPFRGTAEDALETLGTLVAASVARQCVSDVPLGAFLSGGIDSSLVVAEMQRHAARPVRTFSIGFGESFYDEAPHARAVAAHLGTEHTEAYIADMMLRDLVPRLPSLYDEPFADPSQIPMALVAAEARRSVTVALSGDGADELFGGYARYAQGARLWAHLSRLPQGLRRGGSRAVRALPDTVLGAMLRPVRRPRAGQQPNAQWARRLAGYGASAGIDELHRALVTFTECAAQLATHPETETETETDAPAPAGIGITTDPAAHMMVADLAQYLPGVILTKVDRATMAVSLESRAPFLDPDIADFALALPSDMKIRGQTGKWLLRQLCYRRVPRALVDRPKMGFEAPVGLWLRGPLRDWAADLLSPDALARHGLVRRSAVADMWAAHQRGQRDHGLGLWHVLMFQAWHDRWHGNGMQSA